MTFHVFTGDCRETLKELPDECIDSCVTDPPYGLSFMNKQWDQQVPGPDYWREVLRVLKPGAHLLAFGGTRTAHRLACAIEDAGFELRDCLSWLYGSGFPKSHDISKAIDREAGAVRETLGVSPNWRDSKRDRERFGQLEVRGENAGLVSAPATEAARAWDGWGTALKPAWEPIYLARKPFPGTVAKNVLEHGCGALNIDGCRIGMMTPAEVARSGRSTSGMFADGGLDWSRDGREPLGRWPANLVLDEASAAMLDAQTGELSSHGHATAYASAIANGPATFMPGAVRTELPRAADRGGASRFFYVAKASRSERERGLENFEPRNVNDGRETSIDNPYQRGDTPRKNTHPTVKPVALMQWLVKLITPLGGTVLDPFCGSGTTGIAAKKEGFSFIGCEISDEYTALAVARIEAA